MTQPFYFERVPTPIGLMLIVTDDGGRLRKVGWDDNAAMRGRRSQWSSITPVPIELTAPSDARRRLEAYFAGDLHAIDAIRVEADGTPFQREVWAALRTIPVGQTMSYGELAARLERCKAVRAVGLANGANPIAIVVPCHRVIGADGSLTGYGGGLERKQWLLAHEGVDGAWQANSLPLFDTVGG